MHHNFELLTCADGSPVPEYLLGSFVIFQGVRTSIHKEIYSFVCVFFLAAEIIALWYKVQICKLTDQHIMYINELFLFVKISNKNLTNSS